jgi:EpsI family protein
MKRIDRRAWVLALLMIAASGLATAMKPTRRLAEAGPRVELASLVPERLGPWQVDRSIVPLAPPPELQATLDRTYDQTLARTYVDARGRRIMLSIAYGGSHGEGMQTHRPEVCYPAQGFQVLRESRRGVVATAYGEIPVTTLVAAYGPRVEPITYWVVVGNTPTYFGLPMKLVQMRYGLAGDIPDGTLLRVSSLGSDQEQAFALHGEFLHALLAGLEEPARRKLLGAAPPPHS